MKPEKISPLEIHRTQLTESDFSDIQINLENHIIEYLSEASGIIGGCHCTASGLPYLYEDENGDQACTCYDPELSEFAASLGNGDTYSKKGNRRTFVALVLVLNGQNLTTVAPAPMVWMRAIWMVMTHLLNAFMK